MPYPLSHKCPVPISPCANWCWCSLTWHTNICLLAQLRPSEHSTVTRCIPVFMDACWEVSLLKPHVVVYKLRDQHHLRQYKCTLHSNWQSEFRVGLGVQKSLEWNGREISYDLHLTEQCICVYIPYTFYKTRRPMQPQTVIVTLEFI